MSTQGTVAAFVIQIALWLSAASSPANADNVLPPEEIVRAVEIQLYVDEGIESHPFEVSIADGIVTLSGTVDNLLAKERATRQAQRVKGVRGVINRIKVKPPPVPDSELESAIASALREDPAVDRYEIAVDATNGAVTLTGVADSWAEKQLAGTVASFVKGVRALRNTIDVQPPLTREDDELRSEIEQRLRWDMYIDDGLIAVEVADARVTLSGKVGSAAEKRRAISGAYVEGVLSVDADQLEVAFWARDDRLREDKYALMPDDSIASAVREALRHNPRVNASGVSVAVEHHTATLTGSVDNLRARRAASDTAANVVGVWEVKNHLLVRPAYRPSDESIRSRIRWKLLHDPTFSDTKITVTAKAGKVSLYGSVGTEPEKHRAENLAATVKGVVDVANHLQVARQAVQRKASDSKIEESIESRLYWSPFVDSDEVEVTVEDGVATLTGLVDTMQERQAAKNSAIEGGAIAVDNQLTVGHGRTASPSRVPYDRPFLGAR